MDSIGNCYFALCEIPEKPLEEDSSRKRVAVVAHAGRQRPRLDKTYTIKMRQCLIDDVVAAVKLRHGARIFGQHDSEPGFFQKLKGASDTYGAKVTVGICIPALEGQLVLAGLLCEKCAALTPYYSPLPEFVRMLQDVGQGMTQIVNAAYLLAKQQDATKSQTEYARRLEQKDRDNNLLFQSIAHQVSMPIIGLKQAAYILCQGASKEAYNSFRACLKEHERGCRNFKMYQTLTRDDDRRREDLRVCTSFDIEQMVNKAYERVRPYSEATERVFQIRTRQQKGYTIPNVRGNPEAVTECLVNVFHNAIKYSLGRNRILVDIEQESTTTIAIRVTNLGIEIPDSSSEEIFHETTRLDTAKAVRIDGSGIGLFISRKLVALHGGSVRVESCVPAQSLRDGTRLWKTTFAILLEC